MIRLSHLNFFSEVVFFAFHCAISSAKCLLRIETGHLRMHVASASMFPRSTNVSELVQPYSANDEHCQRSFPIPTTWPQSWSIAMRIFWKKSKTTFFGTFDSSGWTKWSRRDVSLNTYTCLGTTINYINKECNRLIYFVTDSSRQKHIHASMGMFYLAPESWIFGWFFDKNVTRMHSSLCGVIPRNFRWPTSTGDSRSTLPQSGRRLTQTFKGCTKTKRYHSGSL